VFSVTYLNFVLKDFRITTVKKLISLLVTEALQRKSHMSADIFCFLHFVVSIIETKCSQRMLMSVLRNKSCKNQLIGPLTSTLSPTRNHIHRHLLTIIRFVKNSAKIF